MTIPEFPLDTAMPHTSFSTITPSKPISSPRDSFSSERTLVNPPHSQPTTSPAASCSRSTTTTTTSTSKSSAATSKRLKLKLFLKRVGNGMLESLAYTGGGVADYRLTGLPTRRGMDQRSSEGVMGDVYGVQLMIW